MTSVKVLLSKFLLYRFGNWDTWGRHLELARVGLQGMVQALTEVELKLLVGKLINSRISSPR